MKGRLIGENIRLIDGIIQYATQYNVPGFLLFKDFEKAFDSLEWPFIFDTLRFFGFEPSLNYQLGKDLLLQHRKLCTEQWLVKQLLPASKRS